MELTDKNRWPHAYLSFGLAADKAGLANNDQVILDNLDQVGSLVLSFHSAFEKFLLLRFVIS